MLDWIQRLVGAAFTTAFAHGLLLWLASEGIHPDRWIAKMLSLAEASIATNEYAYWMLLGIGGLLGYVLEPPLRKIASKVFGLAQVRHHQQDMTAREAIEWIARDSKWAWEHNLLSSDTAISKAVVELDQAARQGRISVLGCNSAGEYKALNRGYWDTAHIDFLDISNPRGSDGQTLPMRRHRNIQVNRQDLMNTWPRAGKLFRLCFRSRMLVKRWFMAIGKYLNISEARKKSKLDRFANEHPSTGNEHEFDRLLDAMAKKPESNDQTSDSSRQHED